MDINNYKICTTIIYFKIYMFYDPILLPGLPYIRVMPKITAVAGSDLTIKCPVAGYPIESIIWERGDHIFFYNLYEIFIHWLSRYILRMFGYFTLYSNNLEIKCDKMWTLNFRNSCLGHVLNIWFSKINKFLSKFK